MLHRIQVGATVVGGVAAGTVAAVAVGNMLWKRATTCAVGRLTSAARTYAQSAEPAFSWEQLLDLPRPVARYFDFALHPGQRPVRRARIRQAGTFAMHPDAWSTFTAIEHFSVRPPGFVWDASINVAPFLSVRVRDGYLRGQGVLQARLAALLPLVDQRGTPELATGELVRYLAEAVWFPTALLPSEGVSWSPLDDSTARATLTDGATTVSLDFHFGPRGEIVRASTNRPRETGNVTVLTSWECHYWDYAPAGGMTIPMQGEAEWILPEGRRPYWRGRAIGTEYEFGSWTARDCPNRSAYGSA